MTSHPIKSRSPLSATATPGAGSTGTGTGTWVTQRITWAATILLSAMVLAFLLSQLGNSLAQIQAAMAGFWPTLLLTLFAGVASYHYTLEVQEVIEDYVHRRGLELGLLWLTRLSFAILALAAIFLLIRNFLNA